MSSIRELLFGALAAVVSAVIILGGLAISMAESGVELARVPTGTPSPTTEPLLPDATRPADTLVVEEPTPPTSTPTPVCQGPSGWQVITFQAGDSMESIAQAYGISAQELIAANCDVLNPPLGTDLYVPVPTPTSSPTQTSIPTFTMTPHTARLATEAPVSCTPRSDWVVYIVRVGDTFADLGRKFGIPYPQLMAGNCRTNPKLITGERILVPNRAPIVPTATQRIPTNTPVIPTSTPVAPSPTSPAPSNTPQNPTPTTEPPTPTTEPPTPTTEPPTATTAPATPTQAVPTQTPAPTLPPAELTPPTIRFTPTSTQSASTSLDLKMLYPAAVSKVNQMVIQVDR